MQRIVRLIKARDIIHVRRADQSSIQSVRPSVIGTLNSHRPSVSVFDESASAVAAHIVKPADGGAFIADNDQALARDLCSKVITGLRDLTLMPDQPPLPGKNLLLLLSENLGRNKILLFERFRSGRQRFSRLPECRDHGKA